MKHTWTYKKTYYVHKIYTQITIQNTLIATQNIKIAI